MPPLPHQVIAQRLDTFFDDAVRSRYFKRMEFAEPVGDQGWFGPGSAVWHVHSHMPALFLGLTAAAFIENLHPSIAWMAYDHSRLVEREDGVPTGRLDVEGAKVRFAHSLAFFIGTAYGSTETAERVTRAVRAMHHTIKGTRPDGVDYDADDPEWLRWNYATVVWGIAAAHERYHPHPLKGAEIDRYYGEFVRVGEALGGTDLPATKADVAAYLEAALPELALTSIAASRTWPNVRASTPLPAQPFEWFMDWAKKDLLSPWAQALVLFRPPDRVTTTVRRAMLRSLIAGLHLTFDPLREFQQATARVAAVPAAAPAPAVDVAGSVAAGGRSPELV